MGLIIGDWLLRATYSFWALRTYEGLETATRRSTEAQLLPDGLFMWDPPSGFVLPMLSQAQSLRNPWSGTGHVIRAEAPTHYN